MESSFSIGHIVTVKDTQGLIFLDNLLTSDFQSVLLNGNDSLHVFLMSLRMIVF